MSADERWQLVTFDDGAFQIDTETIRLRPFPEPRSEAVTLNVDARLNVESLSIHGLMGHREARVGIDGETASFCWQHKRETHRSQHAWSPHHELAFGSLLFNTVTIRRLALQPGQSKRVPCASLDPLTYAPRWSEQTYTRHFDEQRETRFGRRALQHFSLRLDEDLETSHMWCDDEGFVFDSVAPDGSRCVLTAGNFVD